MKSSDLKSGMIELPLTNALFLMRGRPEPGSLNNPESGFYISEPNLDDSMTEQVSHLYTHLNNLIVVLNQHGAILNNILHREKETINPSLILKSIFEMGKSFDPNGLYDSSDSLVPEKAILPLKNKLNELSSIVHKGEEKQTDLISKLEQFQIDIETLDSGKTDLELMEKSIKESSDSLIQRIDSNNTKLELSMKQVEREVESKVGVMSEKVSSLEKETSWKINDCQELLKLRPTTVEMDSLIAGMEQKIRGEIDEITSARKSELGSTRLTAGNEESFGATNKSFSDIYEKLHVFENQ